MWALPHGALLFAPFWPYLLFGARWECPLSFRSFNRVDDFTQHIKKSKKSGQNLATYGHLKVRPETLRFTFLVA